MPGGLPQCEGHQAHNHCQEDPSGDGRAVGAPLGAGLYLHTRHWQVGKERASGPGDPSKDREETREGGGPRAG